MNKKCNIGKRENEIENEINVLYENLLPLFKNCRNITEMCWRGWEN